METEKSPSKNILKNNSELKNILIFIGLFLLVFFAGSFIASQKSGKELTDIFKNAMNGGDSSSKNQEYSDVLKKVFDYYKSQNQAVFFYSNKVESSNILEMNSFKSKNGIGTIMSDLKNALTEFDNFDTKFSQILLNAENIIRESSLTQQQKNEMITGFEKSANDQTQRDLRQKRMEALKKFYEKNLSLYEFLFANFEDYQIKVRNNGIEQVYFYTDSNIARYNQINTEIQELAKNYSAADKEFKDYMNKKFNQENLDINSQDIENYLKR